MRLKKKILFSIIIRGNDKAHWLKILFKRLFSQKEKRFEIIFGNNNSTDETLDLLKFYKIKKKIFIPKYKPGLAINKCLKRASGKYTVIISSHCVPINNNWLSEYLSFMEKNLDIVFADRYSFCVIDQFKVSKLKDLELKNLAQKFYNDTFLVDQNACSSPHLIVWLGDKDLKARKIFWNKLYKYVDKKYTMPNIASIDHQNDAKVIPKGL